MSWLAESLIHSLSAALPPVLSILLSILPPLLSILPSILSTFDAPLVAGTGGEKRKPQWLPRWQERSCDRLRGIEERVFHTT
jgi:hypothetical protein